jgi:hypothetical protein
MYWSDGYGLHCKTCCCDYPYNAPHDYMVPFNIANKIITINCNGSECNRCNSIDNMKGCCISCGCSRIQKGNIIHKKITFSNPLVTYFTYLDNNCSSESLEDGTNIDCIL